MRRVLVAAGVAAFLGLSACSQSGTEATEAAAAAPEPPKSVARQQQFYAGQEQLASVASASISVEKSGGLAMQAKASARAPGYTNMTFLRRIYPEAPKSGIYEVDVVGDRPADAVDAPTEVEVKGVWDNYPKDTLKGVKFMAGDNSVVAMLPAGES